LIVVATFVESADAVTSMAIVDDEVDCAVKAATVALPLLTVTEALVGLNVYPALLGVKV
jgi:hypothetical protein